MPNRPFRFLDSPDSLRALRQTLEVVGLTAQAPVATEEANEGPAEPNPYHPAYLRFTCPWLSRPVELRLHYSWWPDGTHSELERVNVVYDGVVRGEVGVESVSQRKRPRPLAVAVIERIVAVCAEVTGKRKRPSKRECDPDKQAEQ